MKKIYLFAAAAALLTACSSEELANQEVAQQSAETPVAFSIYTPRTITRAGLAGTQTTATVGTDDGKDAFKHGFGVFGYYSNGKKYADANTYPNFMYNQRVKGKGDGYANPTEWTYEPVKYWPNEFGNGANSDDIDRVSFFAYAPWTDVDPSTGVPEGATEDEKNITVMTKNTAIGDPIIKYVVDTDPKTSVDLLWGVAGADYLTDWGTAKAEVKTGNPFIDLLKPNDPTGTKTGAKDSKVVFNLRHALAKLNVQIDYIDDANTPAPETDGDGKPTGKFIDPTDPAAGKIEANPVETKVFIREIKIGGFSMKGALNLNNFKDPVEFYSKTGLKENTAQPKPNWKAYDGENDLVYEMVTFKDGRRDGKEGAIESIADGESFLGLNPCLLQTEPYVVDDAEYPTKFVNANLKGVLSTPANLFANWTKADGFKENTDAEGCIFVIPNDKPINIEIVYDVETVNPKLASYLSDGVTPGSSIENKIRKTSKEIFNLAEDVKMQAGEFYTIKIHLGMTSVKVEASVTPWDDSTATGTAELPYNQKP